MGHILLALDWILVYKLSTDFFSELLLCFVFVCLFYLFVLNKERFIDQEYTNGEDERPNSTLNPAYSLDQAKGF